MPTQEKSLGNIEISPTAVETIASHAINQCYGVVGMANKSIMDRFTRENRKGIEVTVAEDGISFNVYVIVQYGVRIRAVAESIQNTVKFHVEKTFGLPVTAVNIFVQGLRQTSSK